MMVNIDVSEDFQMNEIIIIRIDKSNERLDLIV